MNQWGLFLFDFSKKGLHKAPFFYISFFFILGIIGNRLIPSTISNNYAFACILLFSVLLSIFHYKKTALQIPLFFLWFCVFGYFFSNIRNSNYSKIEGYQTIQAAISSQVIEKQKTYKCEIATLDKPTVKAIIYIKKDSASKHLMYGDVLQIRANFKEITNTETSTFDYKSFLANRHIYSQAYVSATQWQKISTKHSIQSFSMRLQGSILAILATSNLAKSNIELLRALAFGDKSTLESENIDAFAKAGAMHVLAVSGLHVGIIASCIMLMLSWIKRKKLLIAKTIFCIVCIWIYALITGLSPSVQRAAIMFSLISAASLMQRNISTYNSLAASAFISLILEPNALFEIGFQLSYAAVIGIVYFTHKIHSLAHFSSQIYSYIWGIVAVSLAVQITTIPISLYYFAHFPSYSVLTNIMVIPLAFCILACTMAYLATFYMPLISHGIQIALDILSSYLQNVIHDIASFPYASIRIQLSLPHVFLTYIAVILVIVLLEYRKELWIQKQIS